MNKNMLLGHQGLYVFTDGTETEPTDNKGNCIIKVNKRMIQV